MVAAAQYGLRSSAALIESEVITELLGDTKHWGKSASDLRNARDDEEQ